MLLKDAAPKAVRNSRFRTNNTTPTPAKNNNRFPKSVRLGGRTAILNVIQNGKRLSGTHLGLTQLASDGTRFGIGVSKSYGNAVKRNHAKRIIREFLRQNKGFWPEYKTVFIRLRDKATGDKEIVEELEKLLLKIK
jgi:ribonuclease P protein component